MVELVKSLSIKERKIAFDSVISADSGRQAFKNFEDLVPCSQRPALSQIT